mgnify:CR=1 FL=1
MAATMDMAQLETTFPYICGGRIAAEFDARVTVGLEDGVLIAGEVELYCFDDDHNGTYVLCQDSGLCDRVRKHVLSNSNEIQRARDAISNQKQKTHRTKNPFHTNHFDHFVQAFNECHTASSHQKL